MDKAFRTQHAQKAERFNEFQSESHLWKTQNIFD